MMNTQIAALHKLPKNEKIELVQLLWEDIAKDQEYDSLPADHKSILNERLEKIYRERLNSNRGMKYAGNIKMPDEIYNQHFIGCCR